MKWLSDNYQLEAVGKYRRLCFMVQNAEVNGISFIGDLLHETEGFEMNSIIDFYNSKYIKNIITNKDIFNNEDDELDFLELTASILLKKLSDFLDGGQDDKKVFYIKDNYDEAIKEAEIKFLS